VIYAGTRGYLDKLNVSDVGRYEDELLRHLHSEHAALLKAIREEKKLSDANEAKLKALIETFTANFG